MNKISAEKRSKWIRWLVIVALIASIWALYTRTGDFDYINFDDPTYVLDNPHVRAGLTWEGVEWAFGTREGGYPHPLTWLSHMLDVELFGLSPRIPHLENVLFHTGSALLLLYFLYSATGAFWPSTFASALFALHPLRIESVVWVAERKDVLSVFLMLLTLCLYVRYCRTKQFGYYLGAFLLFCLGILSKPSVVVLPALLWLVDIWPLQRISFPDSRRLQWREYFGLFLQWLKLGGEKVPFFLISLGWSLLTIAVLKQYDVLVSGQAFPLEYRLTSMGPTFARYLRMLFWPGELSIIYPYPIFRTAFEAGLAFCILIGVTGLAVAAFLKRWLFVPVGWLWFLTVIFPVSGILQGGSQAVADRYTYFSGIGITFALVWTAYTLLPKSRQGRAWVCAGGVALLATLALSTHHFIGYWRDSYSLFSQATAVTERNIIAYCNLSAALLDRNDFEGALRQARLAHELAPKAIPPLLNMGAAYTKLQDWGAAEEAYRRVLALQPNDPQSNVAIGAISEKRGDPTSAIRHYFQSIQGRPDDARTLLALGAVLKQASRLDLAEKYARKGILLAPGNVAGAALLWNTWIDGGASANDAFDKFKDLPLTPPQRAAAHGALGSLRMQDESYQEARRHFEIASALLPADKGVKVGVINSCIAQGEAAEAARILMSEFRDDPDAPQLFLRVSLQLSTHPRKEVQQGAEAETLAAEALHRLHGSSAFALATLAVAKAGRGEYPQALEIAQKAEAMARDSGRTELARTIGGICNKIRSQEPFLNNPFIQDS